MFWGCSSLTSIDVNHFDTSNVTNISDMFNGCSSLTSVDISNFNTSQVTSMNSMFNNCSGLTNLDISSFNIRKVSAKTSIFSNMSDSVIVKVKDDKTQTWILNLSDSDRPSAWTNANVIIAS